VFRTICIAAVVGLFGSLAYGLAACKPQFGPQTEYPPLAGAPEDPPKAPTDATPAPKAPIVDNTKYDDGVEVSVDPPDDVAAPPAEAKKSPKGVRYVVLRAGKGPKPKASDEVTVHYTGWTTNGKLFDSSVKRGKPATFPVGRLIPGWVEVLQMMPVGSIWRIWVPEKLAYKGADGAPKGMLVFEMQVIAIVK
jgi:hypothetical protein